MEITIKNNIIILKAQGVKLKAYQTSQLEYYGFERANIEYRKHSKNILKDFLRLKDFFLQEKISFKPSPVLSELLKNKFEQKDEISFLINSARNFKEGNYDVKSFVTFNHFLKSLPRRLKEHQKKLLFITKNRKSVV